MDSAIKQENQLRGDFFSTVFRLATLTAALTLLSVAPSSGWTWYSSSSVGADGTAYGWAVANVSTYTMYHVAYVTVTMTSAKGRRAFLDWRSAHNSIREDVSLPFDQNDEGTYFVTGTHSGWCNYCACWLFEDDGSQVSFIVPVPYSVGVVSNVLQGPANCPAGQAGWSRIVYLQLYDQLARPIQIPLLDMADSIQIVQGQNGLGVGNPQTGHHPTDNWGQWPDTYYVCSPVCPGSPAETDAFQFWTASGIPVVQPDLVIYKCGSITVGGR